MSFTGFDLSTASAIYKGSSLCSAIYLGSTKIWPTQHDYSRDYFTIEAINNGTTIKFDNNASNTPSLTIQCSTDNGLTWTSVTSAEHGATIATLNAGEVVMLKGNNPTYAPIIDQTVHNHTITATDDVNISGNIMSLIYGDNFIGNDSFGNYKYVFADLFLNQPIVDASNLIMPATTLTVFCYFAMFEYCSSLTAAPVLPATTLEQSCYRMMFRGCTSLTQAPVLPATILTGDCYDAMFDGCTNLETKKKFFRIILKFKIVFNLL